MMEHPSDSSDDSSDYAGINKKKAIKAGKQPKGGIASESEDSEDDRINAESDSDPEDDVPLRKVVNVTKRIPKGGKPKTTGTVAPRSKKARDVSSHGINKKKAIKAGKQPKGRIASESEDSEDDRINTESDSDPEDDVPLHKVVNVTTKIPKGGKPKTTRTVAPRSTKARDASSPGHGGRSSGRRGRN